ncbi:SulP family inorganic anion transporter [Roseisolibacter agri]|uniref:Sodium-independent anion transporter n=1 Tax=Roseisolibacter agri TaxID=2014610 RepID=A0AA37VFH5_9BACT|nr:SulP family inorganic anion transporter [Roseisolibacter agri]GLC26879.1 sodium-independent anion transporter [Roseisolibacter agri]
MLLPKLLTTLRGYTRQQALADATAGVIVGVVALPLAIAFAIASGVAPERGLWTAIVGGFLISALGGSRVQIGGPTGAFVVVVYDVVQRHGVDGLMVATLMAGAILVVLGVARLGAAIKFIPHPVVTGFTSGIAVIIATGQVRDLLGLRMRDVPPDFVAKWRAYAAHLDTVTPAAVLVAGVALAILVVWPRVSRRVPGTLVALLVTTALVQLLQLPVETIGSRFGAISAALPRPTLPHVTLAQVQALVGPAFTIALLGAVEALLSAVVADGMIGGRHRSNMELVGQGIANLVTPLVGGIPATGAIARTATNVKNGGRTPIAGMVHALTLLLVTLFVGRWAALIPMATLAAILLVVSYHMSEWRTFRGELRSPRSDVAVLLVTFALTVLVDLTVAIEVGMVLAAFLFMRRMAEVTNVGVVTRELDDAAAVDAARDPDGARRRDIPRGVEVYEISGPFFFGAAERFKDTLARVAGAPRVLIIRLRAVPAIDATGLHALRDVVRRSRGDGTLVLLSDVHSQPLLALSRSTALAEIGEANVCGTLDDALARARAHLGLADAA